MEALTDGKIPKSSDDRSVPRFTWLYHVGVPEWVEQSFPEPTAVSSVEVYWLDEGGEGPCRVPKSWRILWRDGNKWKTVEPTGPYGVQTDAFNKVTFKPVTTSIIRVEATMQDDFSAGILEWRVKRD